MSLPIPYIVYGTITDISSNPLESAEVRVSGSSSESYTSDTTDSSGQYSVNIQNYATDGDTVTVTAIYNGKSGTNSFSLTLGELPSKELDVSFDIRDLSFKVLKTPTGRVSIIKVPGKKVYINKI